MREHQSDTIPIVDKKNTRWRNFLLFLAILGPGIITANVDNDAGGIAVYSVAGAEMGYRLLWSLIPIVVALIIIQEMVARMGAVTGKGLADLIRENYGVKVTFYIMLFLVITNLGNTVAEFAGIAASTEIFGVSRYISVPISAFLVWLLVIKGTYKSVEKIFLIACFFYVAYLISGFIAKPEWKEVFVNSVKPNFEMSSGYLYMLIGLVGTSIAPWMQFYLQSSIVEKGITIDEYKHSRIDVIIGCFIMYVVAFFIIVACAATINKAGIKVETVAGAARALQPLAGKYASILFAFGLFNASIFAASILPLSTVYYVCEGMGWEKGIDKRFDEAPLFYIIYTGLIVLGALMVLIPTLPLLTIMFFSQVLNGILLPFILIFILLLINNKSIMGEYTNSKMFNTLSWIVVVVMIIFTVLMLVTSFV